MAVMLEKNREPLRVQKKKKPFFSWDFEYLCLDVLLLSLCLVSEKILLAVIKKEIFFFLGKV